MVAHAPLDRLKDARSRNASWSSIVEAVRELEAGGAVDEHGRRWVQVAAQASGYTPNQIRQATRTFSAIESLIHDPKARAVALAWPLSNLEVVARIAKIDAECAKEVFDRSITPTLRDLRLLYDRVRNAGDSRLSPLSAGHHSARVFTRELARQLSDPGILRHIVGSADTPSSIRLVGWPGGFRYAHPAYVAIEERPDGLRLHAFEGLRLYGDLHQDAATKAIGRAAFEASFFAGYYFCLPQWSDASALWGMRQELGLSNLGVLKLDTDVPQILIPTTGSPQPDRRNMLLENDYMRGRLGLGRP